MLSQKYGLKLSNIICGTLTGLPFSLTKTKCIWDSIITFSFLVIIWFIKKDVLVTDLMKDLILNSSSKCADFLYSMLHDLTIIRAPNLSLIWRLLKPIVVSAYVLALSSYLR